MSATTDLFAAQESPPPLQSDLRSSSAWEPWALSPGVYLSFCGRYTIVRSNEPRRQFLAFRRFGSIENRDWQPPKVLGAFITPAGARGACADHAEANP